MPDYRVGVCPCCAASDPDDDGPPRRASSRLAWDDGERCPRSAPRPAAPCCASYRAFSPAELAIAWTRQRDCNAAIITGTCTVKQMEEYVGAFKLDLPDELMAAVDVVHEQFRNPSMFYHDKPACMKAEWLGAAARSAKDPAQKL